MYRSEPTEEKRGGEPGFQVRRDDFSLQLWAEIDKFFFIRIDTDEEGLVITDLNPGALPHPLVAQALEWAIGLAGRSEACALTVRDIAPGADVDLREAGLRSILAHYAARRGVAMSGWELVGRRSKTDLAVRFSPGD